MSSTEQTVTETSSHRGRRPLTRERIVDAAFHAWGRTRFMHTGIELVARELSVTKPAIYRHIRNKEELVHAMERDYQKQVDRFVVPALTERSTGTDALERLVRRYFSAVLRFYETKPYHYVFYLRKLIGKPDGAYRLLVTRLSELGTGTDEESVEVARFLAASAFFWTTYHHRKALRFDGQEIEPFEPEGSVLTGAERARFLDQATRFALDGFAPDLADAIDMELVERIAGVTPGEIPEADRIFTAIAEVVREYGYADATIERIAGALGMNKSSVYHYFRNRDEMLTETILREQRSFADIASLRFRQLGNNSERLYALFVLLCDYATHRPVMSIVHNWVRESHIEVHIPASHVVALQEIYSFMTDMLIDGDLAGSPDDAFGVLQFVHFLVMQEVSEGNLENAGERERRDRIRRLFRRFTGGVRRRATE
ncbi:MAG: TetR/AcrR family transcriptional regulator [Alkalispirochaeta sp.]